MSRGTRAVIDPTALQHNLRRVRVAAPNSRIWSVIKADAYGHGACRVADALAESDGFAVSTLDEAIALREHGVGHPILLLSGVTAKDHWARAADLKLHCVVHSRTQVEQLQVVSLSQPLNIWLKMDSGMHRLGLLPENFQSAYDSLLGQPNINIAGALTHMAAADVRELDEVTQTQFQTFEANQPEGLLSSIGNSATILRHPEYQGDWVRPGIMLYGATPSSEFSAAEVGLRPAMTLQAPVIAVRDIPAGDSIGYGQRWQAKRASRIATLAIGYGDGYPRHAPDGTPVWLNGQQVSLAGRVSMDLITVDVTDLSSVDVGDMAELWGKNLPVDVVAEHVGTIGYELLTRISARVSITEG